MNVEYNGVILQYASIRGWDETVEYDSSGMNLIANKITLTIEGSVFPLLNSYQQVIGAESTNVALQNYTPDDYSDDQNPIPEATKSFAFRLNTCLRNLSLPRGNFFMRNAITGDLYFEAYAHGVTSTGETSNLNYIQRRNADVNGGPKPRNVRVIQTCNEFARISFSIEITKIRCLAGEVTQAGEGLGSDPTLTESASANFVVSNRCWTEESMDSNFYMTRVFSGTLRISSIVKSVHFYRDMYYPPLEDGFRRESVRFAESEDGLELSYSVTDKQVRCSAPYPATAFSGTCSYSISNSAEQELNMNLTMVGRPDASKPALVSRCMQAVYAKLKEVKKFGNGIMRRLLISENLGDPPSVTVTASYMLVSKETSSSSSSANAQTFLEKTMLPAVNLIGQSLDWDPLTVNGYSYSYRRLKSPVPNPFGYNVFSASPDDGEPSQNSSSGTRNRGKSNDSSSATAPEAEEEEHNPSYGYIKCMATAPCLLSLPQYMLGSSTAAEMEDLLTTKVVKDEPGTEYSISSTDVNDDAVDYPYSFYKSDVTYYTDYSRIVLPKAPGVGVSDSSSVSQQRSLIQHKVREIAQMEHVIQSRYGGTINGNYTGGNSISSGSSVSNEYDDLPEFNPSSLAEATAALVSAYEQLADLRKQLGSVENVRVVEFARPVPKARVVIEAERFGRLPEMPNPDEIVTTTGSDPIAFTCLKAETQICDPRAARNTQDSVSYSIIGTYEYAMSRQFHEGDEIWLLQNPTFGSTCYYPKRITNDGEKVDDEAALTYLYHGTQMNHVSASQSSSGTA